MTRDSDGSPGRRRAAAAGARPCPAPELEAARLRHSGSG